MSADLRSKLTRREFIQLAAGAAGTAVLAGCVPVTPAPPAAPVQPIAPAAATVSVPAAVKGKVEVTWWRSLTGSNGEALDAMVKQFNASQERVKVNVEYQGVYGELRDKLTAAAAAGGSAMPEVVMLADTYYLAFARNKRLEPLDELMKGSGGVTLSDYYGVVERGKSGGVYYQLPVAVSTPVLYYNEDAVKKAGLDGAPKTWDQLIDTYIPKTTVKEGGKTSTYGFVYLANGDWWWQQSYVWAYGGDLSDEKWKSYFDSTQVIDFLTRYQKLFQAGQAYLPTKADGNDLTFFGSGKGATLVQSTGVLSRADEAAGGRFKVGVAYMPEGPSGRHIPAGGAGLCIVAGLAADKKQAAWEFVRWMQQPEQVAKFSEVSGYLPFTKQATSAMATTLSKDSRRKVAVDQLAYSRGQSPVMTVPRAMDIAYDAKLQVMQLKADPKVIMPQIQKQVQAILVEEGLAK